MAKAKTLFFCKECGYESSGWLGKCPGCGAWNSFVEAPVQKAASSSSKRQGTWYRDESHGRDSAAEQVMTLDQVDRQQQTRISTTIPELDRVLGGGLVPGSLLLLGGDPGIGKSTLLLQLTAALAEQYSALYISGEESPGQIKLRAERLGLKAAKIRLLPTTSFEKMAKVLKEEKPNFAVVDSIQTVDLEGLDAAPGSPSQLREATAALLRLAKNLNICIMLIGHVTKEGAIAGPRILEHMVDTVLYFEGEQQQQLRLLRSVKNRFGSTDELGLFEMAEDGLHSVDEAAAVFLEGRPLGVPGTVISSQMEGSRPLLIEIQALLTQSNYAQPLRMAQGVERLRLSMILAVLEKYGGQVLAQCDCYLNIAGGLRIHETAQDLAIAAACVSALEGRALPEDMLILGEIGLSGEIRAVNRVEKRIQEATRLGFKRFICPSQCERKLAALKLPSDVKLFYVSLLTEAIDILMAESKLVEEA